MPRTNRVVVVLIVTISILTIGHADARPTQVQPQPMLRPVGLHEAKRLCSNTTPKIECRAVIRQLLAAIDWQKHARRHLERRLADFQRPVEHLREWTCIHNGEGAWNANTGNGYHGGLQMDDSFMRTYGADMLAKYHGAAEIWTPREQMIVAERAYDAGRGFHPWPQTSRACGLT